MPAEQKSRTDSRGYETMHSTGTQIICFSFYRTNSLELEQLFFCSFLRARGYTGNLYNARAIRFEFESVDQDSATIQVALL